MKLATVMSSALVALTIGVAGTVSQPTEVAQAKSTLKAFPKAMRRTWYHYDGNGHYGTVKVTATKLKGRTYSFGAWSKYGTTIHARNVHADPMKAKVHPWSVATKFGSWTHVMGWNQSAGAGTYYKVAHQRYQGRSVKVFKVAGGADMTVFQHNYSTKKLAKHFQRSSEIYR